MSTIGSHPAGPAGLHRGRDVIITGDDFGLNSQVNEAIEEMHQRGVLTQASLMVNEAGVDEAVRIARRNPKLVTGLHLTLCCGLASRVSALTNAQRELPPSPAWAGLRYAFAPGLKKALAAEIAAQFQRFAELGFAPVYWDGHTHLHLHPTIFKLTVPVAAEAGFRAVRLVREAGRLPLQIIFRALSRATIPRLDAKGILYTDRTFGLEHTGRVDTRQLEQFMALAPVGRSEIYLHPGADPTPDYDLLRELVLVEGLRLISAADLTP